MTSEAQKKAQATYDKHQIMFRVKFDLRDPEQKKIAMQLRKKRDAGQLKGYIMELIQKDMEKKAGIK